MKKRFLSLLLVLVMAVSLFAGLSVTAYADDAPDITKYATLYEVKKGDILYNVCNKMLKESKATFYDVQKGIMVANNFSSETSLSRINPGNKIWIPTSKANSEAIVKAGWAYDAKGKAIGKSTGGGVTSISVQIPSNEVIAHTVKSGDTVSKICKAYKLDYTKCKQAIMDLNGWTSQAQINKIYVGKVIKLPASDAYATNIAKQVADAQKQISPGTGTKTTSGDTFKYYLIKHQMASGETIKGVCGALGTSYSTAVSDQVKTMNNIKDLSAVKAGATYWFPSSYSNGTGYSVYEHKVVAGDTVSNLCSSYGVKYGTVANILQGLNPKVNLNSIARGSKILLVGNYKGTGTGSNQESGVKVIVGSKFFVTYANCANGKISGTTQAENTAVVTITATPDSGYAISGAPQVVNKDTGKSITVVSKGSNQWTFTMPAASVEVSASFAKAGTAYKVSAAASANGSISLNASTAYAGDTVTITPKPNTGYAFSGATITYSLNGTSYVNDVSGLSFTMPAANVTVNSTFKSSHKVSWNNVSNGTLTVSANGVNISNGAAIADNASVAFKPVANTNCTLNTSSSYVSVGGTKYLLNSLTPSAGIYYVTGTGDVVLNIVFDEVPTYAINPNIIGGSGSVDFSLNGDKTTYAAKGAVVTVNVTPSSGYKVVSVTGSPAAVTLTDGKYSFTMGDAEETISVQFAKLYSVSDSSTSKAGYTTKIEVDSKEVSSAAKNDMVYVSVVAEAGKTISKVDWNGITDPGTLGNYNTIAGGYQYYFSMPENQVSFKVTVG